MTTASTGTVSTPTPASPYLMYPTYRFVDEGELQADGTREHSTLEVTLTAKKKPFIVTLGSSVLLNSGEPISPVPVKKDLSDNGSPDDGDPDDGAEDPDSDDEDGFLASLDPFIARVEKMWMEPKSKSTDSSNTSDFLRMKIRARWYFKKEDMAGIDGSYSGFDSRDDFVDCLLPQDLVLGDQYDDNEVPTILGSCRVYRCSPEEPVPYLSKGEYVCRWDAALPQLGVVNLSPYEESKNDDKESIVIGKETKSLKRKESENDNEVMTQAKRLKVKSDDEKEIEHKSTESVTNDTEVESIELNDTEPSDSAPRSQESSPVNTGITEEDNDESSDESSDDGSELGISTSEGKIKIGSEYQVFVLPVSSLPKTSSGPFTLDELSISKWIPGKIGSEEISDYLQKANVILSDTLAKIDGDECPVVKGPEKALKLRVSTKILRECDEDSLLDELHHCRYNVKEAILRVKKNPLNYLTIWGKEEKSQFDAGFKRYCASLRNIAKGVPTKSCKDIVDYHYRFKIPDQFTKFQEKRKEQAQRMAAIADAKNSEDGSKRGKSKFGVSATEQRRVLAREFLVDARDKIGSDRYSQVSMLLKQFHDKSITISQLKQNVSETLGDDGDLMKRFNVFLPKKFRN